MIVKYRCNSCGKEQSTLYRDKKSPQAIRCKFCGGAMLKQLPKIRTIYRNEGFTKHIIEKETKKVSNDAEI